MNKFVTFLLLLGLGNILVCYLLFSWNFYLASQVESKSVLFTINEYGEAKIEAILLILLFPISLFSLWYTTKGVTNESNESI